MNNPMLTINRTMQCVLLMACTLLCACGSSEPPEREVMPVKDTVFAPTLSTLDKAKGVQDTLEQGKAQTDATLKSAEQ